MTYQQKILEEFREKFPLDTIITHGEALYIGATREEIESFIKHALEGQREEMRKRVEALRVEHPKDHHPHSSTDNWVDGRNETIDDVLTLLNKKSL